MKKNIKKFLYWSAGAPTTAIETCPQAERQKYLKLGLTILIPTIFAFCSGLYACSTVIIKSNEPSIIQIIIVIALASIWAFAIYSIDIYLIITYKKLKEKNKTRAFFQVFIRLIISMILGVIISHPLVIKVLEDPIKIKLFEIKNAQLESLEVKKNEEIELKVNAELAVFNANQTKLDSIKASLSNEFIKEMQGNGSKTRTGKPNRGFGEIATAIEDLKNNAETERINYLTTASKRKHYLQDTLQLRIEKKWDSLIVELKNKPFNDIYAKTKALAEIKKEEKSKNESTTNIFYWAILIAFIILDTSAILLKLLTNVGPLDYMVEQEEIKYQSKFNVYKPLYNNEYQRHYSTYLTTKIGLDAEMKVNKKIMEQTTKHIEFIMKERQKYNESIHKLAQEYRNETDTSVKKELKRMMSSLNLNFVNSVEKADKKFQSIISSR
tara:strand:+ start:1381 stop:2697 length:1317 start_codon:yes stop_codon:yes gene_type:complete